MKYLESMGFYRVHSVMESVRGEEQNEEKLMAVAVDLLEAARLFMKYELFMRGVSFRASINVVGLFERLKQVDIAFAERSAKYDNTITLLNWFGDQYKMDNAFAVTLEQIKDSYEDVQDIRSFLMCCRPKEKERKSLSSLLNAAGGRNTESPDPTDRIPQAVTRDWR